LANACGGSVPCLPYGNYYFVSQADIDNFQTAFPNCTALQGNVSISGSDITNLSGLNNLTSIGGRFEIYDNAALTSLTGLENLSSIGGFLEIGGWDEGDGNPSLTSLVGLEGLISIGGLGIGGNDVLTSLSGLNNINGSSISYLTINYNPLLSTCAVKSICDYLVSPNGTVEIHDNAAGCNSEAEVKEACNEGVEESAVGGQRSAVECYPNPTSGIVDFQFSLLNEKSTMYNVQRTILKVYNAQGQEVATVHDGPWPADQVVRWDASNLPAGIYYYRLRTANCELLTGKIVKY
jgi:hypothetical protein